MDEALEIVPTSQPDSAPIPILPPEVLPVPPLLTGTATPEVRVRVESFYHALERIFESWVNRSESGHTRRAYRDDILSFVRFLGLTWAEQALVLLQVSVRDVQRFRETLVESGAANKTLNRRICSLSSFYNVSSV